MKMARTGAPVSHGTPGAGAGASTNSIAQMQQELKTIIATIKQYSAPSATIEKHVTEAFNNFIINNYANSGLHGYERDKGQASDPAKIADPKRNLHNISRLLDTLNNTGSVNNEPIRDGFWDYRTNNALKNVYAYTSAIRNVILALKIKVEGMDEVVGQLKTLAANILRSDIVTKLTYQGGKQIEKMNPEDEKDATTKAQNLIQPLEGINGFLYKALVAIYYDNSSLVTYFSGDRPLANGPGQPETPEQKAARTKNQLNPNTRQGLQDILSKDRQAPTGGQYWVHLEQPIVSNQGAKIDYIHLLDLTDKTRFMDFLRKHNVNPTQQNMVNVIKQIQRTKFVPTWYSGK